MPTVSTHRKQQRDHTYTVLALYCTLLDCTVETGEGLSGTIFHVDA